MKAFSKKLLFLLIPAILGTQSYAQSTILFKGTNTFKDTVLVLDKSQAVKISNRLNQCVTLEQRLNAALNREDKLITLWEQSSKAHKIADESFDIQQRRLLNLERQLELSDTERERLAKNARKERRNGFLVGTGAGAILTLIALIVLS